MTGIADGRVAMSPGQSRFDASVRTWAPLSNSLLLKLIDPIRLQGPAEERSGRIRVARLLSFVAIGSFPPLILSLVPSRTVGGGFWIDNGLGKDAFHLVLQWLLFPALTLLVLYSRRALGDMIYRVNLSFGVSIPIESKSSDVRGILQAFDDLTRPGLRRTIAWMACFYVVDFVDYVGKLSSPNPLWLVSPADRTGLLHFAALGSSQPNLAGLYADFVSGPMIAYVLLLLARLMVEFALACHRMAGHLQGRIMPPHPDRSGGLSPVGRVALILSLGMMLVGVGLSVMILGELFIWHNQRIAGIVIWYWMLYFLLCPVLFLLPLLPLRRLMRASKLGYMEKLQLAYRACHDMVSRGMATGTLKPAWTDDEAAVAELMERTSRMSVWPFDKATLVRWLAGVIGPVVPLLGADPGNLGKRLLTALAHLVG